MEIKVPDLGVDSAEVSEIFVSVGDKITKDENIVLLESDKAAVEVPSSGEGVVASIKVSAGDTVSEGMVLMELEDANNDDDKNVDDTDKSQLNENKFSDLEQNSTEQNSAKDEPNSNQSTNSSASNNIKPKTFALPDLGVDEAQVAELMVEVGDEISADQSIMLVESDKASVEVPAPIAGKVEELLVAAGDTIKNGQDYIVIAGNNADTKSNEDSDVITTNDEPHNGNTPKDDKTKPHDKQYNNQSKKQPNKTETAASSNINSQPLNKLSEAEVNKKAIDVYAGPAVRKLARQLGVDISKVKGSAINNRVVKEDLFKYVKKHLDNPQPQAQSAQKNQSGLPKLPDMSNNEVWGAIEHQDLSRLQKVSIPQLTLNTYLPQVTQFDLSDITETEKLRKELKPEFKNEGIGITILAFIVKASAYALTHHSKFNSHLSDDNNQILVRQSINIGIAVATDNGLIVPVIKKVANKGIKQIAIEINELATKARNNKLTAKELQGASFTISSQGNLGGTYFTPLVNWPQVAILGISEASMQPRWNENLQKFEPRLMLPLSLSYDHRVINGADAAIFTRYIAKLLADPRRILI